MKPPWCCPQSVRRDRRGNARVTMVVPELAQTTDGLKSITRDLSKRNTKDIADLYVHAVSLLCHLKVDQDTLHEYE